MSLAMASPTALRVLGLVRQAKHGSHSCSACGGTDHNVRTCGAQIAPVPDSGAPLDVLIDSLLRSRGYASVARCLAQETTPEAWSERLYDLAELTDCEDLCTAAARAFLDDTLLSRLGKVAERQAERDDLLDNRRSMFIVQAIASLGKIPTTKKARQ